ncbi:MAG: major capsid protein [Microviridae sp.]|nr:MAG: major capsid protein [Microviridae sp.]
MSEVTIGGDRLGAGKKQKAHLHNYERSTHDLSHVWRSTMSSGTLVPFMSQVALPGDTFDIDLDCDVLTHPTIGPLFGTYKVQLDVFQIPMRLYIAALHMNMLGIGRDMSQILFPLIYMEVPSIDISKSMDSQQVNPSSIFAYLGIRGCGESKTGNTGGTRAFNALPYLAYWDIYKQYYANKQEEVGAMIHQSMTPTAVTLTSANIPYAQPPILAIPVGSDTAELKEGRLLDTSRIVFVVGGLTNAFDPSSLQCTVTYVKFGTPTEFVTAVHKATDIFNSWDIHPDVGNVTGYNPTQFGLELMGWNLIQYDNSMPQQNTDREPQIMTFPLENIDKMRRSLLMWNPDPNIPYDIIKGTYAPYGEPLHDNAAAQMSQRRYSKQYSQEGLALKTYQSDLFNNWISTEWIDGTDGIAAITAVDTSAGSFTIDELQLSKKVYDMLNRIAISGGTYDDWLDAVYTEKRNRGAENPMYIGGLIKKIVFQEVVSNAAANDQPLGTLAGRGVVRGDKKGGHIVAKIDEPSYLMGIVSITPNVDYSQGNSWDVNLLTMNDLHKPALDQIGFQDLITDQMAWFDTKFDNAGAPTVPPLTFRSAGKQPAWVNYMTAVNVCRGNFAEKSQQMWMTLNRQYTPKYTTTGGIGIGDVTTYIDPAKFNNIFADTRRDAQNFWTQIGMKITARRKMSAKIMPNL